LVKHFPAIGGTLQFSSSAETNHVIEKSAAQQQQGLSLN
jgi:hypothetical protein